MQPVIIQGCRRNRVPRSHAMVILAILASLFLDTHHATATEPQRLEFTRMVAHWDSYDSPEYLKFIDDAKPEIVQVGFYGAHFWSLGHTPQFHEYPAHFPVQGLNELGDWFESLNGKLHAKGAKVVGHFNVEFLVGDPDSPEGPRGFFKFYRDLWDEKTLGPKESRYNLSRSSPPNGPNRSGWRRRPKAVAPM